MMLKEINKESRDRNQEGAGEKKTLPGHHFLNPLIEEEGGVSLEWVEIR
jgi:hypothetical protein